MNQIQDNKNSSYKKLKELFVRNQAASLSLPDFADYVSNFNQNCDDIDKLAARQDVDKSGLKDLKEILHDRLIKSTYDLSKRIVAYATSKENVVLLKEARISETDLMRLAETKLSPKAQSILDLAIAHADDLKTYGVSQDSIEKGNALIVDFDKALPQPKLGIEESKQITINQIGRAHV